MKPLKTLLCASAAAISGCGVPPDWVEPLNTEEADAYTAALDDAEEHLDLSKDIISISPDIVVDDESITNPTADDVVAEWHTAIDTARDMLAEGNVYVYRGSSFPGDEKLSEAAAYASEGVGVPYVVYLQNSLENHEVSSTIMHETEHVVTGRPHSDEAQKELRAGHDYPFMGTVLADRDLAYRDDYVFTTQEAFFKGITEAYYVSVFDPTAETYDGFVAKYEETLGWLDVAQNDPETWAQKCALNLSAYESTAKREGVDVPDDITFGSSNYYELLKEMNFTQADIAYLLQQPSASYIRETAIEHSRDGLQYLRDTFPEYYQQYLQETEDEEVYGDEGVDSDDVIIPADTTDAGEAQTTQEQPVPEQKRIVPRKFMR